MSALRGWLCGVGLLGLISHAGTAIAHAQVCHAVDPDADTRAWPDYQIILWQDQSPSRWAGLARLGVTAGRIFGTRGTVDPTKIPHEVAPFRALKLRWYIENIATDFYAAYHRWHPDHPVTWLFDQAKNLRSRDPADMAAFVRTPSLSDPGWLRRIAARLRQHVRVFKAYRPLYYSLADEAGIADLAAAWDFDFAPASLAGMRIWLKQRYGSLAALNRQWGTRFTRWGAVTPMSTDAALKRTNENFSAWADFKAWVDIAFARAVRAGANAVHTADPRGRAALEGAQPPGWGGYDYGRLATAVDVLELYDADNNVEIVRSLAPDVVTLATTSLAGPEQMHAVWHQLLLGERGLILWDPDNAFVDDDGNPTQRGRHLGALADALRSGVAAQLIASTPATDPVAILYSPASFRTQWLLDRKTDGRPWSDRGSEAEDVDQGQVRAATQRAARMLTHLGVQPRWLTDEMIAKGALRADHIRMLVLPHTIALSSAAAGQIRGFVKRGGVALADVEPGLFDEHSRRRERSPLGDLTRLGGPIMLAPELKEDIRPAPLARMRQILQKAGVTPPFVLSTADGNVARDIDARVFRDGDTTIIGLQRDWDSGDDGSSETIVLGFAAPVHFYDLRHPGPSQFAESIAVKLNRIEPALIAVRRQPVSRLDLVGPMNARLGTAPKIRIAQQTPMPGARRIAHLEVVAPDGKVMAATNLMVRGACTIGRLPVKSTDPPGDWTVRLTDVLGSREFERKLTVRRSASSSGAGAASVSDRLVDR